MSLPRRSFLAGVAAAIGLPCQLPGATRRAGPGPLLQVRLGPPTAPAGPTGITALGLDQERDGRLFVPATYKPIQPLPFVLVLHGATMRGSDMMGWLGKVAERTGVIMLAPDSRGITWDAIRDDFGPDTAFLERALGSVWSRYAVDPRQVCLAGFSDGATYALALGLANGELFSRIAAFSPGFLIPVPPRGKPGIFISHGTRDPILPIERASRIIVRQLERAAYHVDYHEFDGGHTIPDTMADAAFHWFAEARGS
jgi:phospholipase/carboxylesterase